MHKDKFKSSGAGNSDFAEGWDNIWGKKIISDQEKELQKAVDSAKEIE